MIDEAVQEQESQISRIPIGYWLLLALFVAGLYIFVLMRIDASRAEALHFRYTSEIEANLATHEASYTKPSPFGKPVRPVRASRRAPAGRQFTTISQALPPAALRQAD